MRFQMKKQFAILLSSVMMLAAAPAFAADIQVQVDGKAVVFADAAPFVDENSRTLVPLRPIAEAIGMEVLWDADAKTATFTKAYTVETTDMALDQDGDGTQDAFLGKETVTFTIGSKTGAYTVVWLNADGSEKETAQSDIAMDTEAVIANERTYAPVRYLTESLGYTVGWNDATKTVTVTKNGTEATEPEPAEPAAPAEGYQFVVNFPGVTNNHIAFGLDAKEGQGIAKVAVTGLTVNGTEVTPEDITEQAHEAFGQEGVEEFGDTVYYSVSMDVTYGAEYTFAATLQVTLEDGTQTTMPYTFQYTVDGMGGILR